MTVEELSPLQLSAAYADSAIASRPPSAPIARTVLLVDRASCDGRGLAIDSAEPQHTTVTVRLTATVAGRRIGTGSANRVSCPNTNQPGTHTRVFEWTNPANLRGGDRLRFDIMSMLPGAALPAADGNRYRGWRDSMDRVETVRPRARSATRPLQ